MTAAASFLPAGAAGAEAERPELLLPAGDFASVEAAVQNGADAVYLGGLDFSARQSARNFDEDELSQAVKYCHARGVKVYQTLNTLVFDSQFPGVQRAGEVGCALGIDGFIVQDLGLFALLRECCPQMPLHASTQMTVHTPAGARLLAKMGAKRVVLARELSLEEIREIAREPIETEVFVHGALCMSVSGQCYLSAMIGGRSGNRGSCAGTCRLPWAAGGRPPGGEDHALSLKDLCLLTKLSQLKEAGVTSLKVEGRMKRPEYVAAAARAYRQGFSALDESSALPLTEDLETLRAVFSRGGFTEGYFSGERTREMFGFRQKEDVAAATPKLLKSLENSYKKERGRVLLDLSFEAFPDQPVRLFASDREGHAASVEGDCPQRAENRPADAASVSASLGKLGGTPFVPGEITVRIGENLYLPAAQLNELRRAVCGLIKTQREAPRSKPFMLPKALLPVKRPDAPPVWRGRFFRFDQLSDEVLARLDRFSLPAEEILVHEQALLPYREKLTVEGDRALFGRENRQRETLLKLKTLGFSHLLCQNIAHLALAQELSLTAHGGVFLNAANSRAIQALAGLGAVDQTLSFELSRQDALKISPKIPLGVVVYGRLPLMLLRNCPMKSRQSCALCGQKGCLTDRTGASFPLLCHEKDHVELLNTNPLWLADRLDEFSAFACQEFYFTLETQEECLDILRGYQTGTPCRREAFTRGLYYRKV